MYFTFLYNYNNDKKIMGNTIQFESTSKVRGLVNLHGANSRNIAMLGGFFFLLLEGGMYISKLKKKKYFF